MENNIIIKSEEFLDSPEWIMRNTSSRFKIELLAITDCKYLMWPREVMIELLYYYPFFCLIKYFFSVNASLPKRFFCIIESSICIPTAF